MLCKGIFHAQIYKKNQVFPLKKMIFHYRDLNSRDPQFNHTNTPIRTDHHLHQQSYHIAHSTRTSWIQQANKSNTPTNTTNKETNC